MLKSDYQVRVYDTDGALQGVADMSRDIRTVNISHRLNHPSTAVITMYGLADIVSAFTLDAIVQIKRRVIGSNPELDWYTEYVGFHRTPQKQITETDSRIFTSYSVGLLDLIRRRSIRYYADTDGSSKGPDRVGNVIRAFVRENAGPDATVANGRLTDGVTTGLTVEADPAFSLDPNVEASKAWQNLLEAIRDIATSVVSPLTTGPRNYYFRVEWGGESAANTFEFKMGTGGQSRKGSFAFSPTLGNMASPSYTLSRTEEVTSALVLGPGESVLRDTTLVESDAIADSPWNLIELDVDASGEDRADALTDIGTQTLEDKRAKISFPFQVIQTPDSVYGQDYDIGDTLDASFDDVQADVIIKAVTINISEDAERIGLELEDSTLAGGGR